MSAVLCLLAFLSLSGVDAALAPDQPIPHIYVGDPLILELKSDADATANILLDIQDEDGVRKSMQLNAISLRSFGTDWETIEGAPAKRGLYSATISVQADKAAPTIEQTAFCRIDRPIASVDAPVGVCLTSGGDVELQALSAISLRRVRINASAPGAKEAIERALDADFQVAVEIDMAQLSNAKEIVEQLSRAYGSQVARWDILSSGSEEDVELVLKTLKDGGGLAPAALAVSQPEQLTRLLARWEAGPTPVVMIQRDAPTREDLAAFRTAAERVGYEQAPLYVLLNGFPNNAQAGASLIKQLITHLAGGVVETDINASLVYADNVFGPAYVLLSGFARRLHGAAYVGSLDTPAGFEAHVFRRGSGWCLAAWGNGPSSTLPLAIGETRNLYFTDARNNPLPEPQADASGNIMLALENGGPVYLSGSNGVVFRAAATRMAHMEARYFVSEQTFQNELPAELIRIIHGIAEHPETPVERSDFLALVRTICYLEQEWRKDSLPKTIAVPALASLTRLIRHLCVLEEENGEPFLEPLQDTLNRCSQEQSLYLTQTSESSTTRERGDWLLKEISELIAEARQLEVDGRPIEAKAVANMAEWRARALSLMMQTTSEEGLSAQDFKEKELKLESTVDLSKPQADSVALPEGMRLRGPDDAAAPPAPATPPAPAAAETAPAPVEAPPAPPEESADTKKPQTDSKASKEPQKQVFRVEKGDGPWSIAQKHGVQLEDILKWNKWKKSQRLRVGQQYIVYAPPAKTKSP